VTTKLWPAMVQAGTNSDRDGALIGFVWFFAFDVMALLSRDMQSVDQSERLRGLRCVSVILANARRAFQTI